MSDGKEERSGGYATPFEWLEGARRFVHMLRTLCGDSGSEWRPGRRKRPDVDPELLVAALNWYEHEHRQREELTRKAGVGLPLDEYAAEHELDKVEREVVELLLVCATDLAHDDSRGLTAGELVELLARGRPERVQDFLPYFLPGSRLRRVAGSGMPSFIGPRHLCLEDDVVAALLGAEWRGMNVETKAGGGCQAGDIAGFLDRSGVVLDRSALDSLRTLWGYVRRRELIHGKWGFGGPAQAPTGLGLLFHGPSGTGKSLTARTLARAMGREAIMISYPDLLSKWVGETQKNTRAAFAEAARTGRVLVFDEADAIFARRTNVSSASDKLANNVVNTLLMELERFPGIVVLTTNHTGILDPALERRIRHKVFFGPPEAEARARIWRKHLPEQAPLASDVDVGRLAREYRLTGGQIANAVMAAAALAASRLGEDPDQGRAEITMADFEAAARREAEGYNETAAGGRFGFRA